jgi:hypothetical protein
VRELFIYYRAKAGDAEALSAAVLAAQALLQSARPGLQARLLRRPDPRDEHHTWMETYAFAPHGIDDTLAREIEARLGAVLAPFIDGPRHTEGFVPCAS